jgi:hypothetical protein
MAVARIEIEPDRPLAIAILYSSRRLRSCNRPATLADW